MIFGQSDSLLFGGYEIEGNVKTKLRYFNSFHELVPGQFYNETEIQELLDLETNRLRRSRLFKTVDYTIFTDSLNSFKAKVTVDERWYTWPYAIFQIADPNFNIWWQDKDFNRLKYGVGINKENIGGMGHKLVVRAVAGFNRELRITYSKALLPRWNTSFAMSFREFPTVELNTFNGVRDLYGVRTSVQKTVVNGAVGLSRQFSNKLSFSSSFSYGHSFVQDSVIELQPRYYGIPSRFYNIAAVSFNLAFDTRDKFAFPTKGSFAGASLYVPYVFNQRLFPSLTASVRKYNRLKRRHLFAYALEAQIAPKVEELPYDMLIGFRKSSLPRIYDLYVVNSSSWVNARAQYNFLVIDDFVLKTKFMPIKQFADPHISIALGPFVDAGYFPNKSSDFRLNKRMLSSAGLSLNIVTYYDNVLRIDAGVNSLGEKAVFLNFKKAI